MNPGASRALHRTGQVALAVTAVLGVVCALLTVLALATGVRPLVFRSGSMSPDIPAGSLGFSRSVDAPDIKKGDVVTVSTSGGDKVTHRVIEVTYHDKVSTLRLKGDANKTADAELYPVESSLKLWFSVPEAGRVVSWLSHAPGSYLLAAYVALMLVIAFRRRGSGQAGTTEPLPSTPVDVPAPAPVESVWARPAPTTTPVPGQGEPSAPPRRRGLKAVVAVGAVVAVAVTVTGWGQSTWATWSDTANVSGSTITSGTWVVAPPATPVVTGCTRSGNSITLTWTSPTDPTNFQIRHQNPTTEPLIAGNLRTSTTVNANFNNSNGEIWIVAINGSSTSPNSNRFRYQGNGSNATCVPVP